MMEQLQERQRAAHLFSGYDWNYLAAAILEGHHGEVLADEPESPQIALLYLPNLGLQIVGGDPASPQAREFINGLPNRSFLFFADRHQEWAALGKQRFRSAFFETPRYAFTSESLDLEKIKVLRDQPLGDGLTLKPIDLQLANQLAGEKGEFSEDHFGNFASLEEFIQRGFGYVILEGEKIVSVASTFVVCNAGVEIQINTRKQYEGRRLGTVVGAALIAESLRRGLDPNWDAATPRSAGLARKFGYTEQGEYQMAIVFS